MLQISRDNVRQLGALAARRHDTRSAARLRENYQDYFAALGVGMVDSEQFVASMRESGAGYDIVGERDVFRFCLAGLTLGAEFFADPRFSYGVASSINRTELPASARIILLMDFVDWWLAKAWSGSMMGKMASRISQIAETGKAITSQADRRSAIEAVLPGQWSTLNEEKLIRFLQVCDANCIDRGWTDPHRRVLFTACASLHGAAWDRDPLMKRLRLIFEDGARQDKVRAFYSEIDL